MRLCQRCGSQITTRGLKYCLRCAEVALANQIPNQPDKPFNHNRYRKMILGYLDPENGRDFGYKIRRERGERLRNMRVVLLTMAISSSAARSFAKHFAKNFDPKFVRAKGCNMNSAGIKYYRWYVVRLLGKEEYPGGFDTMVVSSEDLLDKIPVDSMTEDCSCK